MSEHAEVSRLESTVVDNDSHLGPPPSAESVAEVGVRQGILEDLTLKILYLNGSLSLRELSTAMRLGFGVVNELLRRLRTEQLCEVTGMTGNIPQIAITTAGRGRALELLAQNQYAGPAPVSLESYVRRVKQQSVRDAEIHPPDVQRAFAHLVLEPITLKKLGAALNSGTSIFLYGPSGTGKTTIASALSNVVSLDRIWVPYAVEVDGQIITVYDPHVHQSTDQPDSQSHDARWVLCHRPTVLVGGELTIEMLELQLNPITKFYTAPMQMKANNGVLIIDDFGRQRVRPDELLNRWVVPLDRRIDFLSLAGGKKVEIPFEMFVVFATNLDPATLVDAAFLRRIQTKIEVGTLTDAHFCDIFHAVLKEFKLDCEPAVVDDLIDVIRNKFKEPLRACHPRDIINQIRWAARYEQKEPVLDHPSIMQAVAVYFVSDSRG
jgi:predicted ATPase with chaperone activity